MPLHSLLLLSGHFPLQTPKIQQGLLQSAACCAPTADQERRRSAEGRVSGCRKVFLLETVYGMADQALCKFHFLFPCRFGLKKPNPSVIDGPSFCRGREESTSRNIFGKTLLIASTTDVTQMSTGFSCKTLLQSSDQVPGRDVWSLPR